MPNNPSLTPPPLIPISMLGAQNTKSKHQTNSSPPKLQRIPKSEGAEAQTRNSSKTTKIPSSVPNSPSTVDKKESSWFPQTENEFLQSHDGTMPKPAQNIAVMGGKRYIVVPKNNAMAVQPAITVKPDKIGDKPPMLQDGLLSDISNTADNSTANLCAPPSLNTDLPEKIDVTPDKEISKDAIHQTDDLVSSVTTEMTETTFIYDNKDKDSKNTPKRDNPENLSENESFTASIDYVSEKETVDTNCKSPESKSISTSEHTAIITSALEANVETETIKTDQQQSLPSKVGTVIKTRYSK